MANSNYWPLVPASVRCSQVQLFEAYMRPDFYLLCRRLNIRRMTACHDIQTERVQIEFGQSVQGNEKIKICSRQIVPHLDLLNSNGSNISSTLFSDPVIYMNFIAEYLFFAPVPDLAGHFRTIPSLYKEHILM